MTKYVATQDHVGRFGRFDKGDEFDVSEENCPVELVEGAAEAGLLKKVAGKGAGKQTASKGGKQAETASKADPEKESR